MEDVLAKFQADSRDYKLKMFLFRTRGLVLTNQLFSFLDKLGIYET